MIELSEICMFDRTVISGWQRRIQLLTALLCLITTGQALGAELKLSLPVNCKIGTECFFQNFADLDPGPGVRDPWCEAAAYDGHKGTDIRLRSFADIANNVEVIAAADGVVRGVRDGEADRLVRSEQDRAQIAGKECGNGVVISHGDGYETQYCHLKEGSVAVAKGDTIKQGDVLGFIGTSGFSQFPHVHLSVRKNGKWVDAVSGHNPGKACKPFDTASSLFDEIAFENLPQERRHILEVGISNNPIDHKALVESGAPETARAGDPAIVGWAWFINLQAGDRISFTLNGPDGNIVTQLTEPLDKNKATYSAFSGRRRPVEAGKYQLEIKLLNSGETILQRVREFDIR